MIELTEDFKVKVLAALTEARDRYDGSDANLSLIHISEPTRP